jgi:hypothetical protein
MVALLLSTLRSYLKAIGGELKLVVKLPNQRTVILSGIGGIGARGKSGPPKKKTIVEEMEKDGGSDHLRARSR